MKGGSSIFFINYYYYYSDFAGACASCSALMNEKRVLSNTVLELRAKLNDKREKLKRLKKKLKGRSHSMEA